MKYIFILMCFSTNSVRLPVNTPSHRAFGYEWVLFFFFIFQTNRRKRLGITVGHTWVRDNNNKRVLPTVVCARTNQMTQRHGEIHESRIILYFCITQAWCFLSRAVVSEDWFLDELNVSPFYFFRTLAVVIHCTVSSMNIIIFGCKCYNTRILYNTDRLLTPNNWRIYCRWTFRAASRRIFIFFFPTRLETVLCTNITTRHVNA